MQCAMCSVQWELCSMPCAVCSMQLELCSEQCAVCIVQCAVCSVQCAVCIRLLLVVPTSERGEVPALREEGGGRYCRRI